MGIGKKEIALAALFVLLGGAIAVASLGGEPAAMKTFTVTSGDAATVSPGELSDWIITGKRDFALVDMRDGAQHEAGSIRGAVHCGSCHASKEEGAAAMEGTGFVDLSKKLVLFTENGDDSVEVPKIIYQNTNLHLLQGGYQAWKADVLAEVALNPLDTDELRQEKLKRLAVRDFYLGRSSASSRPTPIVAAPVRRVRPHKAAIADEGC